MINVPLNLTLARLIVAPLLLPVLIAWLIPLQFVTLDWLVGTLFFLFSLTDFFDGYLARRLGQETKLGRVLDPIADKFFIFSTLVALQAAGLLSFVWVIVLVGREIFVTSVRYVAREHGHSITVSWLGKIKTVAQLIFIFYAIVRAHAYKLAVLFSTDIVYNILLIIAVLISCYSAYHYYQQCLASIYQDNSDQSQELL